MNGFFDTDLHSVSWTDLTASWVAKCQLTSWRSMSKKPRTWVFIIDYHTWWLCFLFLASISALKTSPTNTRQYYMVYCHSCPCYYRRGTSAQHVKLAPVNWAMLLRVICLWWLHPTGHSFANGACVSEGFVTRFRTRNVHLFRYVVAQAWKEGYFLVKDVPHQHTSVLHGLLPQLPMLLQAWDISSALETGTRKLDSVASCNLFLMITSHGTFLRKWGLRQAKASSRDFAPEMFIIQIYSCTGVKGVDVYMRQTDGYVASSIIR